MINFNFGKNKINKVKTSAKQYHLQRIRKYLGSKKIYSNPVQTSCPSKYAFDALYELGVNTWHNIDVVLEKTIEIMSSISYIEELSRWDAYCTRVTKHNIDAQTRLSLVIERLKNMYKEELAGMGCSLDVKKKNNMMYLYLNTKAISISNNSSDQEAKPFVFYNFRRKLCNIFIWLKMLV